MFSLVSGVEPPVFLKILAILGAGIGMATDMKWGKIYNWLTLPLILTGWVVNGWFFGFSGLTTSLFATFLGISLYLGFALVGAVGMGDVKLLAGIGALGGVKFVVGTFLYTSIIGIPHSLIVHYLNYGKSFLSILTTSLSTGMFLEKTIQKENTTQKFHFYLGLDIFLGTLLAGFIEIPLSF